MIARTSEKQIVYCRSMGKAFRVLAIADNDDDANKFMENNRDTGVISVIGDLVFIADLYDTGVKIDDGYRNRGDVS